MKSILCALLLVCTLAAQNPQAPKWPTSIVTDADWGVESNLIGNAPTLTAGISAGATSMTLSSGAGWLAPVWILIDSEYFHCTTLSVNVLSGCTPNAEGSAQAAHAAGAAVHRPVLAQSMRQVKAEITSLETHGGAGFTPVSFSATPVFTCNKKSGDAFSMTLTADVSSSTLTGCAAGEILTLRVCQDSGGSHLFVPPTTVLNMGTVSGIISSCSTQSFVFDGANAQALGMMLVTPAGALIVPTSGGGAVTIQPAAGASLTTWIIPHVADTAVGKATTDIFLNKTLDTASTGNVLKIAGTQITALSGNNGVLATTSGAFSTNDCTKYVGGNFVSAGAPCGSGGAGTNTHFVISRDSATQISITAASPYTVVSCGDLDYQITGVAKIVGSSTWAAAASRGQLRFDCTAQTFRFDTNANIDPSGGKVAFTGSTITQGISLGNASTSAFGTDSVHVAILTAGAIANTWDASPVQDMQGCLCTKVVKPGTNVTTTYNADGSLTVNSTGGGGAGNLIRPCEIVIGDPGAASPVLANDNDSPAVCGNAFGATLTITAVACYADAGSPTVTPIITGGGATSLLTGALTCGTGSFASGTLNGTPTQAAGATIDGNVTVAGGSARYAVIRITRTL